MEIYTCESCGKDSPNKVCAGCNENNEEGKMSEYVRALKPRNFLVKCQDNRIRRAKYIYARNWRTEDKLLIQSYYESNMAVTQVIDKEEYNKIEYIKTGEPIELYYEVFQSKRS